MGERFPVRVKIAELRESGCFSEGEMPSENGRKTRGAVVFQAEGRACEFLLGKRGVARVGADRASVAGAQTAADGDWHEAGGACRAPSFDLTLRTVILSLKTRGASGRLFPQVRL